MNVHRKYNTQCSSNFHLKLEGRILSQIIIGGRGGGGGRQGKSLRIKREILEGTVWPYLNVGLFDTR